MPEGSWARFDKQYKDETKCRDLFAKYMWPNGVECIKCGHKNSTNQLIEISDRKINATFKCEKCHKIFEIQTNCILTGSPVPFYDWLRAIFRIAIKTNSTSSHSMPDEIDVIQDSGWKLFLRIGELAKQNILLENQIEMDEWYEGPKPQYQHKYIQAYHDRRGIVGETIPIFGMVERGIKRHKKVIKPAKLVLQVLNVRGRRSVAALDIKPYIDKYVSNSPDVVFFTDAAKIYQTKDLLSKRIHKTVPHNVDTGKKKTKKQKEKREKAKLKKKRIIRPDKRYVKYEDGFCVHTNNIEGVFSQLSTYIRGTHRAITREHMQKYLDLFCFRWNNRHLTTEQRLDKFLSNLDKVPHRNIWQLTSFDPVSRKSKKQRIFEKLHEDMIDYLNQIPYKKIQGRNMFLWIYQCSLEESLSETHETDVSEYPYDFTEDFKSRLKSLKEEIKKYKKANKWLKCIKSEYNEVSKIENIHERIDDLKMRIKIGLDIEQERAEISEIRAARQRFYSKQYYERQKQKKLEENSKKIVVFQ